MASLPESLENRLLEHLAITVSRCDGCQECQQIFVSSGHFLILERAKNISGLTQVSEVDGLIL
jgi:hypothetical protein